MNKLTKRALEQFYRNKIWIEKAAREDEVAGLVNKLKPTKVPELRRFGPAGDGGYLMPDDLEGVDACISPGVSFECGFDEEIASRGIDVIMADASVDGPPTKNPRFHFMKKFVDIASTDQTISIDQMSRSGKAASSSGDLLLQMDIEGAEYRVLGCMSDDLLRRFRVMVIEFHNLDQMFSRFSFNIIKPVFDKLTINHTVVHIHPNNCAKPISRGSLSIPPVMEFTFYRKDRMTGEGHSPVFPHPLDVDNLPNQHPVDLPQCWWR